MTYCGGGGEKFGEVCGARGIYLKFEAGKPERIEFGIY